VFVDETEIVVVSGRGGDGVVHFRREKYVPKGGPDGGDGGRGGGVVLRAAGHLNTLAKVQHGRTYRAGDGRPGEGGQRTGASGTTLVIDVPPGTLVRDAERGHVLRDLARVGDEVVIVEGGAGGRGNRRFASPTNQVPRRATPGRPGQQRRLRLELKLVADVGLLGLPNAGKSTFLSRVSAARPKVADYPFTTLAPSLGLVDRGDHELVVADIPGLIEGSHRGAGLGDRFLRHVERTRVLLHLVDGVEGPEAAVAAWRTIREELRRSSTALAAKPTLVALSRVDACPDPEAARAALREAGADPVLPLSSVSGTGVRAVLAALDALVARARETGQEEARGPRRR